MRKSLKKMVLWLVAFGLSWLAERLGVYPQEKAFVAIFCILYVCKGLFLDYFGKIVLGITCDPIGFTLSKLGTEEIIYITFIAFISFLASFVFMTISYEIIFELVSLGFSISTARERERSNELIL